MVRSRLVLVSGVVCCCASALGQGTLTYSDQSATADAAYRIGANPPIGNSGVVQDFSGADFYGVEDRAFIGNGFDGRGYAEHGATFTASNPLIGGMFSSVVLDACTSAEVTQSNIGVHSSERAYGLADGIIEFSLSAPMFWSWAGGWQGNSFQTGAYNRVRGHMSLVDINVGTPYVSDTRTSLNGVGDWQQFFALGGLLGPGDYRLRWSHESIVTGGGTPFGSYPTALGGAPLVSCIDSTFSLMPVPEPTSALLLAGAAIAVLRRRR